MKLLLNPKSCGCATAAITVIVYILCIALFAVAPEAAYNLGQQLFHGVQMSSQSNLTFGSAVFGLIFWLVSSYVTGWLFAVIYNNCLTQDEPKA